MVLKGERERETERNILNIILRLLDLGVGLTMQYFPPTQLTLMVVVIVLLFYHYKCFTFYIFR